MNIIDYLNLEHLTENELEKVILVDREEEITVARFLQMAVSVGMELARKQFFDSAIAVVAEQTWYTPAFFLGILLSGNYYIALSPELTEEKRRKILEKSRALAVCITDSEIDIADDNWEIISKDKIDNISESIDINKCMGQLGEIRKNLPENPILYEVFTSGSTGEPKGIVKSHQAMIEFLDTYIEEFSLSSREILANQTPFYFDASAKDIYLNWKLRCTLHIFDKKMFIMPIPMIEYFNQYKVSMIQWVPSALCILSKLKVFDKVKPLYLKKVFFVGEVFPIGQLKIWMDALPDTEFINLYGSSEMCGICAYYRVPHNLNDITMLPIGKPLKNVQMKLISDGRRVTDAGDIGEIYVQYGALAEGYVGLEDKNESAFVEDGEGRWYCSGDLAKRDEEGQLCFVSRKDYQIKHMGHRIELGEIEQTALKINGVEQVCCIYQREKIQLFYSGTIDKKELLKTMRETMVSYMVPNKVIQMDHLPVNANGKIDRQKIAGGNL